jgi:hypothetical protein
MRIDHVCAAPNLRSQHACYTVARAAGRHALVWCRSVVLTLDLYRPYPNLGLLTPA